MLIIIRLIFFCLLLSNICDYCRGRRWREAKELCHFVWRLDRILVLGNLHSLSHSINIQWLSTELEMLIVSLSYTAVVMVVGRVTFDWPHSSPELPKRLSLRREKGLDQRHFIRVFGEGQWAKWDWREEISLGQGSCLVFSTVFLGKVNKWCGK